MLTMYIQCGTGNQLFIFSTGYALAKKLGVELQLDITDFSRANYRGYTLPLFKGVKEKDVIRIKPTIIERSLRYSPAIVSQVQDGDCLQGYFQSEKYFSQYKVELQEIFQPKQPLTERGEALLKTIEHYGDSSVMIHIRRGDYVGFGRGELTMDYYERAIESISEKVKDPVFFVFSDDPQWCKNNLVILHPWFLIDQVDKSSMNHIGREDEDLYLMSRCHHAIIANSTFSWWGAWLSPVPDSERTVIAPTPWFSNKAFDTKDIVPESWTKISSRPAKVLVALFSCDKLKYRSRAKLCVDSWKNQLPPNFTLEVFTGSRLGVDDNWGAVDKVKGIIRYALESGYDYLMKIDDDTEVRWDKVQVPKADYAGWMSPGINKEWPYDHCQGGCYWLSRAAMEILDKTPVDIDPTIRHMEDRWVCKYLHDAGIYPTDLLEFTMNPNWEGKIKHWKPNAVFNHFWSVLLQSEGLPKITASEKLRHIANPEYDFIGEGHQVAFRDGKIVELNEKGQVLKVIRDTRA